MFHGVGQRLHARSVSILARIETGLPRIMLGWLVAAFGASALRVAVSPLHGEAPELGVLLPYLLLVLAPVASMALALRWFADGHLQPQPTTRMAVVGRWRTLSLTTARSLPLYGASGLMVSLLVGILLNVPIRALEYLAITPALNGPVPAWLSMLRLTMTLDVVLFSSLYAIAFVAALRRVPLFPRLLVAIWAVDLAMQLIIAAAVTRTPGLPPTVADALHQFLEGNVRKVLVSVGLWLPYLLLSKRVNLTYRLRIPV